jgi:hypothetical protein
LSFFIHCLLLISLPLFLFVSLFHSFLFFSFLAFSLFLFFLSSFLPSPVPSFSKCIHMSTHACSHQHT